MNGDGDMDVCGGEETETVPENRKSVNTVRCSLTLFTDLCPEQTKLRTKLWFCFMSYLGYCQ